MKAIIFWIALLYIHNAHGQIEGVVTDKNKKAISNAIIIAIDSSGKIVDTAKSDIRGGYLFKGLKPNKYNVEAKAPGFQSVIYKNILITTPPEGTDPYDDTYYAVRLDIIFKLSTDQKQ